MERPKGADRVADASSASGRPGSTGAQMARERAQSLLDPLALHAWVKRSRSRQAARSVKHNSSQPQRIDPAHPVTARHLKKASVAPMRALIVRTAAFLVPALIAASAAPAERAPPRSSPACPQVEGWTPKGTIGPIESGDGVELGCVYALPGQPEQLTLYVHWYRPTAPEVDVNYSECGRASSGGSYYTTIYSDKSLVYEEYTVTSGPDADNVSVFQAEQQHIQTAAHALLAATETHAKSCTSSDSPAPRAGQTPAPTAPPAHNTTRPVVQVHPETGRAGKPVALSFTVSDDSGYASILLTMYQGSSKKPVLSHDYGEATAQPTGNTYSSLILAHGRGRYLWCITAIDAAGNSSRACSSLVVR